MPFSNDKKNRPCVVQLRLTYVCSLSLLVILSHCTMFVVVGHFVTLNLLLLVILSHCVCCNFVGS
jgi:hypothetical protein